VKKGFGLYDLVFVFTFEQKKKEIGKRKEEREEKRFFNIWGKSLSGRFSHKK
jgi:hypothetical protein